MSAKGWIKLHRKLQHSEVFNDPDLLRLWMLCLMKASHTKRLVEWQGDKIELLPGQFITGRSALCEDYNENLPTKHLVKDTTLWTRLKKIESMGSLKIEMLENRKASIVTLLKWDEHQTETDTSEEQEPERKAEVNYNEEVSEEMSDFIKAGEESGKELAPAPKKQKLKKGKREYEREDIEYKLASRLYYWMLKNNPKAKKPDPQKWADIIRLTIERDDRDPEDIKAVIDWCQNDDFWMLNILSPDKLRKQFDRLYMQMSKEQQKKSGIQGSSRGAKKNDLLREMMEKEARNNGQGRNDKTLFLDN